MTLKNDDAQYELARAAAADAANRHMRQHGRTKWNQDDLKVANEVFYSLMPDPEAEEER